MNTERIIICLNEDGTFKAASAQDFGGLPFPISLDELQKLGLGGLAEIEALNAAHATEVGNLRIDFEAAATLRKETLEKHAAEIEKLKADHADEWKQNAADLEHLERTAEKCAKVDQERYKKLEAEFAAYRSAAETAAKAAKAAIADQSLDDTATVAKIDEITTAVLMPVEERRKQEALAKIAAIKKEAGLE